MDMEPLTEQLLSWEYRVSKDVVNYIKKHLLCFFDANIAHQAERSGHVIIALMLDPRFKSMKCLLKCMSKYEGKVLIGHYDRILLEHLVAI